MNETGMNDSPMSNEARARMSADDAAQWEEIQQWKAAQVRPTRPRVISQRIRSTALAPLGKVAAVARKVPGGDAITRAVSSAALGLVDLAASASEASVRRRRILKAYCSAGYRVERVTDIRGLSLAQIRAIKPRLNLAYSGSAAAEGAVSGVFASGGSAAALLGMGVASAPGVGVTTSAIALDIVTFLAAATRLVSHTAAYYGYDTVDPAENLFSTMVLSQAIDPEGAGREFVLEKQATMLAFNKVMRDLAKRGPMDSVGNSAIAAALNSLFSALGARLVGRKLAQIVPVAGIIVGAGLNASLMRTIGDTADHLYRERFLVERYGHIDEAGDTPSGTVSVTLADDIRADIARYVELAQAEGRSR